MNWAFETLALEESIATGSIVQGYVPYKSFGIPMAANHQSTLSEATC